jgi:hypothetical protein
MKKTVILLLALSSTLSFAQTLTIHNLNRPTESIELTCIDKVCSEIIYDEYSERVQYPLVRKEFKLSIVNKTIENRRGYIANPIGGVYETTSETSGILSQTYQERRYATAILQAVGVAGSAILDTASYPIKLVAKVLQSKKVDSRKDKAAAKRIKLNLLTNFKKMVIKNRYYEGIRAYLNKISE